MQNKTLLIFNPSIEGGGVEKNLFIISNFLSKKIRKVKLICANSFDKKIDKNVIIVNSKILKINCRLGRYLIALFLLFTEILKNKNVVVLSFQANLYATILCIFCRTPIIIRANSSPTHWAKNIIKRKIYSFFYKYPKKIIVNSIEFKFFLKKLLNLNSKTIYNPLDIKFIKKRANKKIKLNFFKKQTLNIISIGRLAKQKDYLTTLKALELLNNQINFRYIILGQGKEEREIKNFIFKKNLNKKIKLFNFKKNPYPYLKKSDVLILSSIYEGLPNVLLEAMALKKFVIASNCPTGPAEILKNGKYGLLFEPQNFTELSKKINFFYKNKKKCQKLSYDAYNDLNRFSYQKNLNNYFYLIKSIC